MIYRITGISVRGIFDPDRNSGDSPIRAQVQSQQSLLFPMKGRISMNK
jgi:hypothetical protein